MDVLLRKLDILLDLVSVRELVLQNHAKVVAQFYELVACRQAVHQRFKIISNAIIDHLQVDSHQLFGHLAQYHDAANGTRLDMVRRKGDRVGHLRQCIRLLKVPEANDLV